MIVPVLLAALAGLTGWGIARRKWIEVGRGQESRTVEVGRSGDFLRHMVTASRYQESPLPQTAYGKRESARIQISRTLPFFASPFPRAVGDVQWNTFVHMMVGADDKHIGIFGFSLPRLADLKIVDASGWVKYTPQSFLSSWEPQYWAFVDSCRDYISFVLSEHREWIGVSYEGNYPASLSGILAVLIRASYKGAANWVRDPKHRSRFQNTTSDYLAVNNLF